MHLLSPGPASIPGIATTLHLALALLRHHRRQPAGSFSPVVLISFSFALLPWILETAPGILGGLALHAAWFAACEKLLPPPLARRLAPAAALVPPVRQTMSAPPATVRAAAATLPTVPAPARRAIPRPRDTAGFVRVPVVAVFDETSDIRTFRLLRPAAFDFEAGQFLAVRVRIDGQEYVRCYSISSAPDVTGYLEISVKRLGVVSNALHATLRPGSVVSLKAPGGAFRYPSDDDRPILLLAGGIGITPLMSMLRHAITSEPMRPVTVVYAAQHDRAFAFREELRAVPKRHPQVRLHFVADRSADPHVYQGRIDEALLRTVVPDLVHAIAFVCGPKPMLDSVRTLLAALGVPAPQIRYEVFEAAVAVAAGLDCSEEAPDSVSTPSGAVSPASEAAHAMACTGSHTRVPVQPGQTMLEAAEGAGVAVASLCRSGVCGTCRVRVTSGDVRCHSTTLGEHDRREGYVLACVTTVHSDCAVEI